jgi:cyclase
MRLRGGEHALAGGGALPPRSRGGHERPSGGGARRRARDPARRRLGAKRDGRALRARARRRPSRAREHRGPTIGICLGLQLALDSSEEDGGVTGLGLVPGRAVRLREGRVPRVGWAIVEPEAEAFYFAHSYAAETPAASAWSGGHRRRGARRQLPRRSVPPGEERPRRRPFPRPMRLPRLIPCLDVAGGRVVKGVRFKALRDGGDPVELGAAYSEAGADELVFLDIAATLEARPALLELVARIAERLAIPFTVGGGLHTVADAEALLRAGADKDTVNSAALERPELIGELAARVGSRAVVVAIDARDGQAYARAGTVASGRDAVAWAQEAEQRGAGGDPPHLDRRRRTRAGYDLEQLTRAVANAVSTPVIASGGAGEARHVADALDVAQAALLASIVHENPARLTLLRTELRALGVPLRDAA